MMIINLPQGGSPQKTCLRVRKPTCGSVAQQCANWKVRVSRVGCTQETTKPAVYEPCWADGMPKKLSACAPEKTTPSCDGDRIGVLEYPVFDTDESGRVCFYWDDLLLQAQSGRYDAWLIDAKGCRIACFQINLEQSKLLIDQAVSVLPAVTCEEGVNNGCN
jgi:hypothetical protein